jgi:hypothetical protein
MLHVFLIHIDMSLGLAAADVLEIMITMFLVVVWVIATRLCCTAI